MHRIDLFCLLEVNLQLRSCIFRYQYAKLHYPKEVGAYTSRYSGTIHLKLAFGNRRDKFWLEIYSSFSSQDFPNNWVFWLAD